MKPVLRKLSHRTGYRPGWAGRAFFLVSLLLGLTGFASLVLAAPVGTFIQVEGTVEVLRHGKPRRCRPKSGVGWTRAIKYGPNPNPGPSSALWMTPF